MHLGQWFTLLYVTNVRILTLQYHNILYCFDLFSSPEAELSKTLLTLAAVYKMTCMHVDVLSSSRLGGAIVFQLGLSFKTAGI